MQTQISEQDIKIKEYINKYLKELQRHFEIPDNHMHLLLGEVYQELAPPKFIDNLISMVKSFYNNKLKGIIKNGN